MNGSPLKRTYGEKSVEERITSQVHEALLGYATTEFKVGTDGHNSNCWSEHGTNDALVVLHGNVDTAWHALTLPKVHCAARAHAFPTTYL